MGRSDLSHGGHSACCKGEPRLPAPHDALEEAMVTPPGTTPEERRRAMEILKR
ncbi:MAG: hypothetical protein KJ737_06850 [Proteobacteria bacterium]|nr:hypothetical protein [Pseudomonadota bacterium]